MYLYSVQARIDCVKMHRVGPMCRRCRAIAAAQCNRASVWLFHFHWHPKQCLTSFLADLPYLPWYGRFASPVSFSPLCFHSHILDRHETGAGSLQWTTTTRGARSIGLLQVWLLSGKRGSRRGRYEMLWLLHERPERRALCHWHLHMTEGRRHRFPEALKSRAQALG